MLYLARRSGERKDYEASKVSSQQHRTLMNLVKSLLGLQSKSRQNAGDGDAPSGLDNKWSIRMLLDGNGRLGREMSEIEER